MSKGNILGVNRQAMCMQRVADESEQKLSALFILSFSNSRLSFSRYHTKFSVLFTALAIVSDVGKLNSWLLKLSAQNVFMCATVCLLPEKCSISRSNKSVGVFSARARNRPNATSRRNNNCRFNWVYVFLGVSHSVFMLITFIARNNGARLKLLLFVGQFRCDNSLAWLPFGCEHTNTHKQRNKNNKSNAPFFSRVTKFIKCLGRRKCEIACVNRVMPSDTVPLYIDESNHFFAWREWNRTEWKALRMRSSKPPNPTDFLTLRVLFLLLLLSPPPPLPLKRIQSNQILNDRLF